MSSVLLIENGPWLSLQDITPTALSKRDRVEGKIARANTHLRQSLGLRQEPIELRTKNGELELRVRGIAGTLSVGNLTLDIAPKFVPRATPECEWNNSLLMLVRYAHPRHVVFNHSIHLGTARLNFIDLMAMAFVDAVQAGLRDQIIQTYQVEETALTTIRGRLNIQRQIRSSFLRPHLIECDLNQLDPLNPYNNLLKWGANVLAASVRSPGLRRRVSELARTLPGKPNTALAQRHPVVKPPPQFRAWEPALEICSLLFSGFTHTSNRGTQHGYSFVFNMERLFEHFVENVLKYAVSRISSCVLTSHRQATTLYAYPESPANRGFYSKPDNLLTEGGRAIAVVDAKYKRLSDAEGTRNRKPQNQDVYELVAAMTAHQCNIGVLVYPKVISDSELNDGLLHTWHVNAFGKKLTIGAIALDLMALRSKDGVREIEKTLARAIDKLILRNRVIPS